MNAKRDLLLRSVVLLSAVLVLYGLAAGAARPQAPPPPGPGDQRVCLPLVWRAGGLGLQPTLGPSPTPTRTPLATLGPSPTPTPVVVPTASPTAGGSTPTPTATPPATFYVAEAQYPERGNIGTEFIFTLGLYNLLAVPVQVTLTNTLPEGLRLDRIWPPTGTVVVTTSNSFTAWLTVPHDWTDNLFFRAVVEAPPCTLSCYVQDIVAWSASWSGGSNSGTTYSLPILLVNVTPTPTPVTPTRTPPIFPTWPPTPTPTAGPSPTPTTTPTAGPSSTPTLPGATPSPTPAPTLGPSPTPTPGR